MSLIQDLIEWASSGDVSPAYDDAKKQNGWNVGEPPLASAWNEVENARDRMINRVKALTASKGTASPDLTPAALCAGLTYGHDWSNPANGFNNLTLADEVRDACICWDSTTETPFILVLLGDNSFVKISGCGDYESSLSTEVIEPTFASTPDGVWALCCDGTNVYVAWYLNSDHVYVSAHPLSDLEGTPAWTCDTGETYLAGRSKLLCDPNTDRVFMTTDEDLFDTVRRLYVIDAADGSLIGSGTGSWVSGYGDASDSRTRPIYFANHVWWIQYQMVSSDRHFYLVSAKITNPTTSDFDSVDLGAAIAAADTWDHPQALVQVLDGIAIVAASGVFDFFKITTGSLVSGIVNVTAKPRPNMQGGQDSLLAHDGQNIWFLGAHTSYGPVDRPVAYKIPSAAFRVIGAPTTAIDTYSSVPINTDAGDPPTIEESGYPGGRLLFDGEAVWCILRNGMVFRITNPGNR